MTRRDFVALLGLAPAFRRLTKEPRWRTRHPVVFEKCREMGMTHARWADFTAGWRPLPPGLRIDADFWGPDPPDPIPWRTGQ